MAQLTFAQWQQRALALPIETRAFIGGRYTSAADGATFDCVSPVDGRVLGQVASCNAADAQLAVTAAREAFENRDWSGKAPAERKRIMLRFVALWWAATAGRQWRCLY
jgi:4-guanidinobutyraldehyde dehydrogenase/NAD-dependent aldehyde dehydrogenase